VLGHTHARAHCQCGPPRTLRASGAQSLVGAHKSVMRSSVTLHRHSLPWGSPTLGVSPAIVHRMRARDARAGGAPTAACFLLRTKAGCHQRRRAQTGLKLPQYSKVSRAPRGAQDGGSLGRSQGTGQVKFKFNDAESLRCLATGKRTSRARGRPAASGGAGPPTPPMPPGPAPPMPIPGQA
jgi:hypothetical protein